MCGQRLKELRRRRGLTQTALSRALGLSPSAIGMYEQNRREPDGETMLRFADFFGVTLDDLMGRTSSRDCEVLDAIRRLLNSQEGLMFNGEVLTEDDLEQIYDAIEMGAAIAMARKAKAGKNGK